MIVELRLLIFEVKSWRSSGASFKNQNSSINPSSPNGAGA
jgi:hypothetical protein